MIKLRYVGGAVSEIMDTPYQFKRYGQLVEMPEELAEHALANGLSLLTEEEFSALRHPENELKEYGDFRSHGDARAEFINRRNAAWGKVHANIAARLVPAVSESVTQLEEKSNG